MNEPASSKTAPTMAILAGGLATRLRPITNAIAKSMVSVGGEPFIAKQLRMLASQGISDVVLLCGFLGEQIEEFVGDGMRFGCHVRYRYDGETQLGTGGALRRALPLLGENFMAIYGDSFCRTNYLDIYRAFEGSNKLGLMTVFRNADQWDRSNVIFRDGEILRYDKAERTSDMQYIDYGINVFSAHAFDGFSDSSFDLAALQMSLVARRQLAGFEMFDRFYEVGSHSGLAEADVVLTASAHGSGELQ